MDMLQREATVSTVLLRIVKCAKVLETRRFRNVENTKGWQLRAAAPSVGKDRAPSN